VTVPLEALGPDGIGAELDHAGMLGSAAVRQLACDAAVMRS
jgi:hypothetical protein